MDSREKITLLVDNNSTYVRGRLGSAVYEKLKKALGYQPEEAFWMIKKSTAESNEKWKQNWDGHISTVCWNKKYCHCHIKKDGTHFPTGLLRTAVEVLRENQVDFTRVDIRSPVTRSNKYSLSEEFECRDYQQEVIDSILGVNGKTGIDRGILKVATGGGKTSIACGIIAKFGVTPSVFYVPSVDLLHQAKNEIKKFIRQDGSPVNVGMVGGGQKDIQDITVMTIQTAVKALGGVWVKYDEEDDAQDDTDINDFKSNIKELVRNSKLMICDEVQHWAAETCQIISDNSVNCKHRFGMSATPFRDRGDDILIDSCFGRSICDISASFLIKKGHLIKPIIYFSKIDNMKKSGLSNYANIYKSAIVENSFRNNKIVELACRFRDSGRKVLILIKHIAHGKMLEKLIEDSIFLYGDTSKKKRLKHLDQMRQNVPMVTIASSIFDEGIDCRPLDTLILAGSGKSPTRALQRIGRILRPFEGKEGAIAVDFMDHCKYMLAHSKKRMSIYRSEEEFEIINV